MKYKKLHKKSIPKKSLYKKLNNKSLTIVYTITDNNSRLLKAEHLFLNKFRHINLIQILNYKKIANYTLGILLLLGITLLNHKY